MRWESQRPRSMRALNTAENILARLLQLPYKQGMKHCSKCKRELPETEFWKGRNKTGIYPSCKECELKQRANRLLLNPLCVVCKSRQHMAGDVYCYECSRIKKGRGNPKWESRRTGLEWCKICGQRPRLDYHQYCYLCKREYNTRKLRERRSTLKPTTEERRIFTARSYATGLLQQGKIKRGPCVFCGQQGTQFHHYDYEPRTRNFDDVCFPCHVQAHKFLNLLLTIRRMLA